MDEVYIEVNFIDTPKKKTNIEIWEDLTGDDEILHEEFARVITNEDIPKAGGIFDPENLTITSTWNSCWIGMTIELNLQESTRD